VWLELLGFFFFSQHLFVGSRLGFVGVCFLAVPGGFLFVWGLSGVFLILPPPLFFFSGQQPLPIRFWLGDRVGVSPPFRAPVG